MLQWSARSHEREFHTVAWDGRDELRTAVNRAASSMRAAKIRGALSAPNEGSSGSYIVQGANTTPRLLEFITPPPVRASCARETSRKKVNKALKKYLFGYSHDPSVQSLESLVKMRRTLTLGSCSNRRFQSASFRSWERSLSSTMTN